MGSVSEKSTIPTASPADEHAGLRGMGRRRGDHQTVTARKSKNSRVQPRVPQPLIVPRSGGGDKNFAPEPYPLQSRNPRQVYGGASKFRPQSGVCDAFRMTAAAFAPCQIGGGMLISDFLGARFREKPSEPSEDRQRLISFTNYNMPACTCCRHTKLRTSTKRNTATSSGLHVKKNIAGPARSWPHAGPPQMAAAHVPTPTLNLAVALGPFNHRQEMQTVKVFASVSHAVSLSAARRDGSIWNVSHQTCRGRSRVERARSSGLRLRRSSVATLVCCVSIRGRRRRLVFLCEESELVPCSDVEVSVNHWYVTHESETVLPDPVYVSIPVEVGGGMVESCERIDRVVLRGLPCWPSASCIPPCFFSTLGLTNHTRQQKRQRLVAQEQQFPRPDDYLKLRRAASHEFTSGRSVVRSIFLVSTSWTRIANDHKDTIHAVRIAVTGKKFFLVNLDGVPGQAGRLFANRRLFADVLCIPVLVSKHYLVPTAIGPAERGVTPIGRTGPASFCKNPRSGLRSRSSRKIRPLMTQFLLLSNSLVFLDESLSFLLRVIDIERTGCRGKYSSAGADRGNGTTGSRFFRSGRILSSCAGLRGRRFREDAGRGAQNAVTVMAGLESRSHVRRSFCRADPSGFDRANICSEGRAMTAWTQLFEPGPALVLLIALLVPQTAVADRSEDVFDLHRSFRADELRSVDEVFVGRRLFTRSVANENFLWFLRGVCKTESAGVEVRVLTSQAVSSDVCRYCCSHAGEAAQAAAFLTAGTTCRRRRPNDDRSTLPADIAPGRSPPRWKHPYKLAMQTSQVSTIAPLNEHDMTDIEYYPVADSTGCYYNFQHYDEGDRIITNEPCLNCTCHNRMLMCYLRVCPFTKAIGQDCKVEKRADQCCPVITCPEVPVQLLTSTTQSSTAVGHLDAYGCSIDGLFYSDGARVPSDPNKPCELCYCIRNKTACVMQECTLKVEGCKPVYQEGVCCPVRYDCGKARSKSLESPSKVPEISEHPDYNLLETTTRRLITTTTETPTTTLAGPVDCIHNNEIYADGALVIKDKPCEHCYCMRGDIVCAVQECSPTPLDKVNCTALPPKEGQCCPDNYECEHMIEEELTTGYSYTTPPAAGFDEIATTQPSVESKPEEEEGVTPSQTEQPIEITSPPGEESTVPSVGKEGEVAQEPVTILPVEAEKEQPGQLPESPEKEDHEEPVKSGVTPLFDEAAHVTEGAVQETEKPISQEQVTEQPEDIPATVKPEVEIPDQEVNEIPEEHEIVTAGPHVPEHDEIVHPEETEYPTQEHEAGSGEEPHVTETEVKVTETPGVTEGEGTIVPQQPVHVTEQQPTEGQQTEGPQVHVTETEGVVTELPQKPETETEGITEGDLEPPQHVPIDEGEEGEEEVPEKHLTEQGKETEVPKDVTAAMDHGTTELPHVVGHVTETAPEIGTGLPHEMEAEGTERQQGEVTEIPHEVITQGQVEEGEVTEIPQVPVTEEVHEISKIPSDHVPKGEEGQGEITEIPQYVTEGAAEEGKATEMPRVTEAQTSKAELPQTGVTEGESTELPQQHVTEAGEKSTEMPQEPIVVDESTGAPQEQGPEEGTELPHKHVPEITELPGEHVTQGQETELPKEHVTNIPVTEGEITEQPTQAETGTELPKDHTEGEGTELPEGHVTQVPISEAESTELPKEQEGEVPKEQMTQLPVTDEESTELPKEQEEIPKEHMTQLPVTEEESTELPKEEEKAEGPELPKEHMTQAPITEDESTGLPKEQEKEQIPGEHLTQVPMNMSHLHQRWEEKVLNYLRNKRLERVLNYRMNTLLKV
ncbi:hypothetical protein GEV33_015030 [Tenebrio molitor]|uniref:VWFC domain-containing protein n=1 Tax=Tenebrio molitor TaxID=7067 RepID=A0A8J6H4E3_TENMO|nr:hypothetical protein GEV33_015030 [Tenebrio molitor]